MTMDKQAKIAKPLFWCSIPLATIWLVAVGNGDPDFVYETTMKLMALSFSLAFVATLCIGGIQLRYILGDVADVTKDIPWVGWVLNVVAILFLPFVSSLGATLGAFLAVAIEA